MYYLSHPPCSLQVSLAALVIRLLHTSGFSCKYFWTVWELAYTDKIKKVRGFFFLKKMSDWTKFCFVNLVHKTEPMNVKLICL